MRNGARARISGSSGERSRPMLNASLMSAPRLRDRAPRAAGRNSRGCRRPSRSRSPPSSATGSAKNASIARRPRASVGRHAVVDDDRRSRWCGRRARSRPRPARSRRSAKSREVDDRAGCPSHAPFGSSMMLTCAATMRQPSGKRTQVCICRPILPGRAGATEQGRRDREIAAVGGDLGALQLARQADRRAARRGRPGSRRCRRGFRPPP